jgi:hypothetical protein
MSNAKILVIIKALRRNRVNPFMPIFHFFLEVDRVAEWGDGKIGGDDKHRGHPRGQREFPIKYE